jgi:hypothetical protein
VDIVVFHIKLSLATNVEDTSLKYALLVNYYHFKVPKVVRAFVFCLLSKEDDELSGLIN